MRNAWMGILGLVAAAGLTWWLLGDATTSQTADPIVDSAQTPDVPPAPALKGTGDTAPGPDAGTSGRYLITGKVVDEDDEPIAGVPIELWRRTRAWPGMGYANIMRSYRERVLARASALLAGTDRQEDPIAKSTSDEDGRFEFRVNDARYHTVYARPALPAAGGYATANLISGIKEKVHVTLRVYPGAPLEGHVEDAHGKRVNAQVLASYKYAWRSAVDGVGPLGLFEFAAVPDRKLDLVVTLPGGPQFSGFVATPPFDKPVVLRLPGGTSTIDGVVQTPDGEAIPDGFVTVRLTLPGDDPKNKPHIEFAAQSDADGRFAFTELPAGEVTQASATADGFLAAHHYAGREGFAAIALIDGQTADVELTLRRGSTVLGRVTDKETGRPVEGATATLYFLGWVPPQTSVRTTDADGRYRFDGIGDGRFILIASHPGYFAPEIEAGIAAGYNDRSPPPHLEAVFTKKDQSLERDLTLVRGAKLSGIVLDPDGQPAGGARVYLKQHGLYALNQRWALLGHGDEPPAAVAAPDGKFAIDALAPRTDWVLLARKVGYAAMYSDPVSLEDGPVSGVEVRLERQCIVRGHVLDADGKPLADQWIYVTGYSTLRGGDWKFKTQADGSFEIDSMPASGHLNLSTSHERKSVETKVEGLTPGEIREGVVLHYGKQVAISGTVHNSKGEPLADLRIFTTRLDGLQEHRETRTNDRGAFKLESVSPGRLRLSVSDGHGGREHVTEPLDAPARGVSITHDPPPIVILEGTVVGPDGVPVAVFDAQANSSDNKVSRGRDFTKGAFKITARGKAPYSITVTKPRSADGTPMNARPGYRPVADPAQPTEIRLDAGVMVAGRVVAKDGKGVVSVTVESAGTRTKTDNEGAWRLLGLQSGPAGILVRPPKEFIPPEPVVAQPGQENIEIRLEKGVSVSGRVVLPKGVTINAGSVNASWERQGRYAPGRARGVVQPSGTFTVHGLPPGISVALRVTAYQPQGTKRRVAPKTVEGIEAGRDDVEIVLEVGVEVSGTVVNQDGTPCTDCTVSVRGNGSGSAKLDSQGRFTVGGLLPGTCDLMVFRGPVSVNPPQKVTAPATDIRVVLPARGDISGRVLDPPKGERWIVTAVDAKTGGTGGLAQGTVESDGSFTVGPIDKGRLWVLVARRDDGESDRYGQSEPLKVGDAAPQITLRTGVSISGRVDRNGKPAPQTWISATAPGFSSGAVSDAEGNFTVRGLPEGRYTLRGTNWSLRIQGTLEDVPTGSRSVVLELNRPN